MASPWRRGPRETSADLSSRAICRPVAVSLSECRVAQQAVSCQLKCCPVWHSRARSSCCRCVHSSWVSSTPRRLLCGSATACALAPSRLALQGVPSSFLPRRRCSFTIIARVCVCAFFVQLAGLPPAVPPRSPHWKLFDGHSYLITVFRPREIFAYQFTAFFIQQFLNPRHSISLRLYFVSCCRQMMWTLRTEILRYCDQVLEGVPTQDMLVSGSWSF